MKLTIDYCTECGYIDRALEAARLVMEDFGNDFEQIQLVPSEGGVFRVSIESEVVFDLDEEDYSVSKIREGVEEYLEQDEVSGD